MKLVIKKIIETNKENIEDIFSKHGRIFTFLNPVSYLQIRPHKNLYRDFDGLFADGSLLVRFIKIFYGETVQRYSFDMTSLAPKLFDYASQKGKTIYLVGAKEGVADKASEILCGFYKDLRVIGTHHGYFENDRERMRTVEEILTLKPDFVIVGMGAVVQDEFLRLLKREGFEGVGFSCGGYIHQVVQNGNADYYPQWIQKLGLRFLYRMCREPHTRKRYFYAGVFFPLYFIVDRLKKECAA